MDEYDKPDEKLAEHPVLDPRDARARHRKRTQPAAGLVYLRTITAQEHAWMARMVRRTARAFNVDADDLMQELRLGLLTCDAIDSGRTELRGWLSTRARWRAADLLRAEAPHRRGPSLAELDTSGPAAPDPPAGLDPDWNVPRLRALGLNRDEAQVVLLVLWGLDVSLHDFAVLVGRGYPKTRQDRSRGLRKIENLFGLDPEESAALIAFRQQGTADAAAIRLDLDIDEVRRLVRSAEEKIDNALGRAPAPGRDRRDEDQSHAR